MNQTRQRAIYIVGWAGLIIFICCTYLFAYFPFPEDWIEIKADGTSTVDDLWYIGNGIFYVSTALVVWMSLKPGLYTNLLLWVSFLMLADRFVSPYYGERFEWIGWLAVFIAEFYRWYRARA